MTSSAGTCAIPYDPEADTTPFPIAYRTHESERESNARDTFCE